VQVDPIKAKLKAPGSKRLKLRCAEPVSNFAFKFNLRRYIKISEQKQEPAAAAASVGRCRLNL
jgi:hypothetical protein